MTHREATRVVVLADPTYPQGVAAETLHAIVGPHRQVTSAELGQALEECDLLVSFHGPYFPQAAWPHILAYLEQGGNLAVLGGVPFTNPVRPDGTREPAQESYAIELGLGLQQPIEVPGGALTFTGTEQSAFLDGWHWQADAATAGHFWALAPKLTQRSDHPTELGSAGTRDVHLLPLVQCASAEAAPFATPFFLLEQMQGRFRGGRWLIAPWLPANEASLLSLASVLNHMLRLTAEGAQWCEIRPTLACYQPGEVPQFIAAAHPRVPLTVTLDLSSVAEQAHQTWHWEPQRVRQERRFSLPGATSPGLHRFWYTYQGAAGIALREQTGYWIWDEAAVRQVEDQRLVGGRDLLYQQGSPFFVYGTTYMDRQVQRRFLTTPNPALWDADFATFRAAGINLVRTGLWTAWDEVMPVAGHLDEAILRALDAFVMTACRHEMQVIFTLFAFSPPLFSGENPWLDPRSRQAQQDFAALLASRYAQVALVSWDLINEPSFGDPQAIFDDRPQPLGDPYERQAFQRWLQERHHTLEDLRLHWRLTPSQLPSWEAALPPEARHFSTDVRDPEAHVMVRVGDFTRFSQEMVRRWATEVVAAMRAAGGQTLIGIGQDEAEVRPAPQFYAPAVDYTTTHPWWNTGDLLWDMVIDKTLDKPNLIQEVGVMLVRDVDGRAWRSEAENAGLLERKLYLALAARGAGVVQWLWHTNALMRSDNENHIGLLRADGSAKPELAVMQTMGACISAIQSVLIEPPLPDIWLVAPYAQWFIRPALGVEPTQHAVHTLGYAFGIVPQVIADANLPEALAHHPAPKVLMLPGSQCLDEQMSSAIQAYVRQGGTLYLSGMVNRDAYALPVGTALFPFMQGATDHGVAHHETLIIGDQTLHFHFAGEKPGYVRKAHHLFHRVPEGAGTIMWSGIPAEFADSPAALQALYAQCLGTPGRQDLPQDVLVIQRPLADGQLIIFVSEAAQRRTFTLASTVKVAVAPQRAGAIVWREGYAIAAFGGVQLLITSSPGELATATQSDGHFSVTHAPITSFAGASSADE